MKRIFSRVLVVLLSLAMAMTAIVACQKKVTEDTTEKVTLEIWTMSGTAPIDQAAVTAKINEVLVSKINAEVNFNYIGNSDYAEKIEAKLAAKEAGMDLVYTSGSDKFAANAGKLGFADITEAVYNGLGDDIVANIPEDVLNACKVNGVLYGVPTIKEWSDIYALRGAGVIMKHLGLFDEMNALSWSSLNDDAVDTFLKKVRKALENDTTYFSTVHDIDDYSGSWAWSLLFAEGDDEANAAKKAEITEKGLSYFFNADSACTVFNNWQDGSMGGDQRLGNLVNWVPYDKIAVDGIGFVYGSDKDEAVNVYGTDAYLASAKKVNSWIDAGITSAKDSQPWSWNVFARQASIEPLGISEGQVYAGASYNQLGYLSDGDLGEWALAVGQSYVSKSFILASVYSVAAQSEHVNRAVMYLNVAVTDEDINNLFNYGVEGVSYNLDANGKVEFTDYGKQNDTWATSAYNAQNGGNLFIRKTVNTNPDDFWASLKATNNNISKYMNFSFDSTGLDDAIATISQAKELYHANIFAGTIPEGYTIDSYIAKFNEEIADSATRLVNAINQQYANK